MSVEIYKPRSQKVLIPDAGGRGHAIAERYARSPYVDEIIMVPGNDFAKIEIERTTGKKVHLVPNLKSSDAEGVARIAKDAEITFADVCQDDAVAANVAGRLRQMDIPVIGADSLAGMVETDKGWFRERAKEWGVPQPEFSVLYSAKAAKDYVTRGPERPLYIKGAFLSGGKDALSARTTKEALERIDQLVHHFDRENGHIVIEEWMLNDDGSLGEEFSALLLCDGNTSTRIIYGQDYKRALDGDRGEQTGSMGSVGPTNLISYGDNIYVDQYMARPIIDGLAGMERFYKGWLYISGIIVMQNGRRKRKVVEVNARPGDPETQVLWSGILNDYFELSMAAALGELGDTEFDVDGEKRVVVTIAANGYPGDMSAVKGREIWGIREAQAIEGVSVYGGGIAVVDNKFYIKSGRIIYVVGRGDNVQLARDRAYFGVGKIVSQDDSTFSRSDIAWRDLLRYAIQRQALDQA